MNILVVGGAGYIGSHTVYGLVENGDRVVVADSLETGHREAVHPDAAFYRGDVRDGAFLDGLFSRERIDAVVHFAAYSLVGESMQNPLRYFDNNVGGTRALLERMLAHGVGRIVFSSTAAVYGDPRRVPIAEGDRAVPTNPYGETKLCAEKMLRWANAAHGLQCVSLRYFNACGAHESGKIGEDHSPETHLIPLALQAANGGRDHIDVFGNDYDTPDGTCVRDYVHVDDLAAAHILAVRRLAAGGESGAFNLGNGKGFSVLEVVEAARRVTGHPIPTEQKPRRAGDPARLVASGRKAKRELGWTPRYRSLEDIIASAWKWHGAHPNGFRR